MKIINVCVLLITAIVSFALGSLCRKDTREANTSMEELPASVSLDNGYLITTGVDGKFGLTDTLGVWVLDPLYNHISWIEDNLLLCITNPEVVDIESTKEKPTHLLLLDKKLRIVMETDWPYLLVDYEGSLIVTDNETKGLISGCFGQ